ncbi:MAG TPA: sialate O-acetylesterase [Bacteroidales bacterium]|nr:sialate O-acetylesterase [Bacteroidales bacterium]
MKRFILTFGTLMLFVAGVVAQNVKPFQLFHDNMVVQRHKPVKVWGQADPESEITVSFNNVTASCNADENGKWMVGLPAIDAGGPYDMSITSGDEAIVYKNILVGDVWIASGQSNMGYRMKQGVLNNDQELADANYPEIRYFEVAQVPSLAPEDTIPEAEWKLCTPENVGEFSAVAYFFAQKVHTETGVPIGIINSSWGGSSIEAWMSPEALAKLPHSPGPDIESELNNGLSLAKFNAINNANTQKLIQIIYSSNRGVEKGVEKLKYDDSDWPVVDVPGWGKVDNQIYWLRKEFELDKRPKDSLQLSLGLAGGFIKIYLNGKKVFETNGKPVDLTLPAKMFRKGKNVVAFRLANAWWYPYMEAGEKGFALQNADGELLADLSGKWKYSTTVEEQLPKTYNLQTVPTALYNGMLYPLFNTPITGVIWYQGETNGDQGIAYRKLFTTMISEWRIQFRQGYFPFFFVQLANLGNPAQLPEERGWPYLREAQDMALELPYTGMATAIDVGNRYDIHPKDKKTVGYRLALDALYMTYHKRVVFSGPCMTNVTFDGNKATVHFEYAEGLKTNNGEAPTSFAMAGPDHKFYLADTKIDGNTVVLSCPEVPNPVAVRYAWAKNPVINLYNGAGLPALPFRTDDWPPAK